MLSWRLSAVFFVTVATLLPSAPARAQSRAAAADLVGVVADESGAVIVDAAVTATAVETGLVHTAATQRDGRFVLAALPVGAYRLRAERAGFRPVVRESIVLTLGTTLEIEIALPVAAIQEAVTVTADAPPVDTHNTAVSTIISQTQIASLPIHDRNFVSFALLTPGVFADRTPDQGATRSSGLTVNGQTARANNIMVDGLDNNDEVVGSVRATFSQDAVREFQVLTSTYSAEFGKASGAVVNIVTKSGTNRFAGSAFEFNRNRSLNASDYFEQFDAAGNAVVREKAPFSQNQFGGTFGGPIRKGRSFFFASIERLDQHATKFVAIDDRTPVPHPLAPGLFLGTPAGILRTAGFPVETGHVGYDIRTAQTLLRLDHRLTQNHLLIGRFNTATEWNEQIEPFGGLAARSRGGVLDATDVMGAAALTSVLSPGTVNELRVLVARRNQDSISLDPLCNGPCDLEDEGGPTLEVAGYAVVGRQRFTPAPRDNIRYQVLDSMSWFRGAHQIKAGVDFNLIHGIRQALPLHFGGRYIFPAVLPLPIGPGGSLVPISSIQGVALGLPAAYVQGFGYSGEAYDYSDLALFAQDEWRLRRGVTINLGVRYQTQFWGEITNSPLGYPGGSYTLPSDRNNFAPRVGIAWDPRGDQRTSIHGGYAISYANLITANPPISKYITGRADGVRTAVLIAPLSFAAWAAPSHRLPESVVRQLVPNFPSVVIAMDPAAKTPFAHHVSGGVSREIAKHLVLSIDAVFLRGFNQLGSIDYNPTISPGRRPADVNGVPGTSASIIQATTYGQSWYRGLTLSLNRRFTGRAEFLASYTLSKAEDTVTDFLSNFVPQSSGFGRNPNDPNGLPLGFDPLAERGPSLEDQRHRFTFSGTILAPAGIELSTIVRLESERPFNILAGADLNGDGDAGNPPTDRPRTDPANAATSIGRNAGRLPAYTTADVRISRAFALGGSRRLTLIAECFNLFNKTTFVSVQNIFGTGRYPSQPLPTFGQYTQAAPPRQAQLAIRFSF